MLCKTMIYQRIIFLKILVIYLELSPSMATQVKRPANPIEGDQLPIFDLEVSSINYLGKENKISHGYQITFSAPKASHYDIRYAEVEKAISNKQKKDINNAIGLRKKDIVKGSLKKKEHKTKNTYEEYEMIVKDHVFSRAGYSYYVIVKAFDKTTKSYKRVSNIVMICSNSCGPENNKNIISQYVKTEDEIEKVKTTESYPFDDEIVATNDGINENNISPTIYQHTRTKIGIGPENTTKAPKKNLKSSFSANLIGMIVAGSLLILAGFTLIVSYFINQCRKKDYPVMIYTVKP